MASVLVMSPGRDARQLGDPPLQTPIMRLESIFERTSASPQPKFTFPQRGRWADSSAAPERRHGLGRGNSDASGGPGSSSKPRSGSNAASASGAADAAESSPSPEPRAGSDASSDASSSSVSPSPDAVSEVGPLPDTGFLAAAARRSPFRGAASMSLDQVLKTRNSLSKSLSVRRVLSRWTSHAMLVQDRLTDTAIESLNACRASEHVFWTKKDSPASNSHLDQVPPVPPTTGGGYRVAGGGRSPSPLRRFPGAGPGANSGAGPGANSASAAALRRRDSSAVSMSIMRETPLPPDLAAGQPQRAGSRARSSSVMRAPSGETLLFF